MNSDEKNVLAFPKTFSVPEFFGGENYPAPRSIARVIVKPMQHTGMRVRRRQTVVEQKTGGTKYQRIRLFAAESGYSEKAIRRKIEDGIWVAGREYRKAPDGNILIDVEGYERWVAGGKAVA